MDDAAPGLEPGPGSRPGPLVLTLQVDGEVFEVRRNPRGGTAYDWVSGPNPGYGFASSAPPDLDEQHHREQIHAFLSMIDPVTGFIGDT